MRKHTVEILVQGDLTEGELGGEVDEAGLAFIFELFLERADAGGWVFPADPRLGAVSWRKNLHVDHL